MQDLFRIGVVAGTHGLRGHLKIFSTTEDSSRFDTISTLHLHSPAPDSRTLGEEIACFNVQKISHNKNMIIVKLSGIDNIDEAAKLKGSDVVVPRSQALPLSENEYYVADLLGLRVVTDTGEVLGHLKEVLQTGANDVYVVSGPTYPKPILIPAISQCILNIDIHSSTITVHLLKGLI